MSCCYRNDNRVRVSRHSCSSLHYRSFINQSALSIRYCCDIRVNCNKKYSIIIMNSISNGSCHQEVSDSQQHCRISGRWLWHDPAVWKMNQGMISHSNVQMRITLCLLSSGETRGGKVLMFSQQTSFTARVNELPEKRVWRAERTRLTHDKVLFTCSDESARVMHHCLVIQKISSYEKHLVMTSISQYNGKHMNKWSCWGGLYNMTKFGYL